MQFHFFIYNDLHNGDFEFSNPLHPKFYKHFLNQGVTGYFNLG